MINKKISITKTPEFKAISAKNEDYNHFTDIDISQIKAQIPKAKRKKSTIICQLDNPEVTALDIQKMMEAGANVIQMKSFKFSRNDRIALLQKVEEAERLCCLKNNVKDWPVATCVELKTCAAKTGILDQDREKIHLKLDSEVILTCSKDQYNKCNEKQIFIDTLYLTKNVIPGNFVSIKGDEIILKCTDYLDVFSVKCMVVKDGELVNVCPINLKGAVYHEPLLLQKDYEIMEFAVEFKVDIILVNFTREVKCLKEIRKWFLDKNHKPMVICGVATPTGINNFEEIAEQADALLIPRDFLEFEMDETRRSHMLRIQKWMAAVCRKVGKQFFIGGGVFKEAIESGIPSESEVFDVTNSLLEGASGFLLKHCFDLAKTCQTIASLNDVCRTIEPMINTAENFWNLIEKREVPINAARAAAISCLTVALVCNAKAIIVPTVTGSTIKLLLSLTPSCPVLTVSTSERVKKRLAMFGNLIPLVYRGASKNVSFRKTVRSRIEYAVETAVQRSQMQYGDYYVTLERANDLSAFCDTVRVWKVELITKSNIECPSDHQFYETENYLALPKESCLVGAEKIFNRDKPPKPTLHVRLAE